MRPLQYHSSVSLAAILAMKDYERPPEGLERKDSETPPDTVEVKKMLTEFMGTFEEFKRNVDAELKEVGKGKTDPIAADAIKKLNEALDRQKSIVDEIRLDLKRTPQLVDSKGNPLSDDQVAHKKAFSDLMRKGLENPEYAVLAAKALSVGVDPNGGYLAPIEVDREIGRLVSQVSPIRQVATVRNISTNSYKKPFNLGGTSSGWVGETSARPQTSTPTLVEMEFPAMELYAQPGATQTLLDDAYVDIEQWLADEVQIEFAEQEGKAFVTGDGLNKPRGFIGGYTPIANANWVWGQLGFLSTGVSGGFAATNPADKLIDLLYAPKVVFRTNGNWMMNRKTQAEVRKFKDTTGQYLWQPSLQADKPDSLLGYPITIAEDMADMAANSYSLAFGDFKRGYLIVDRVGIRVLRDPFTAKPYVLFYTTKRVGGGVQNFEAIKLLKFI